MSNDDEIRSQRVSALLFGIAGAVFLLTALLDRASSATVFLVLGLVFVVLALNAWRSQAADDADR